MAETVTVEIGAEQTVEWPRLAVGTIDVYGVRYVRLDHVLQWLEDVDDADLGLDAAAVRATLAKVEIGADRG